MCIKFEKVLVELLKKNEIADLSQLAMCNEMAEWLEVGRLAPAERQFMDDVAKGRIQKKRYVLHISQCIS